MAASIVRLEGELTRARDTVLTLRRERAAQDALIEELRAEVALLREERAILQQKFAGVIEGSLDTSGDSDLSPRTNVTKVRGVPIEELREDFLEKWRRDQ